MQTARWIVSTVAIAIWLWLSYLNWVVFWKRHVLNAPASSWIPLLGGLVGAIGVVILPVVGSCAWAWVPFVFDWGSVPGISYSVFWHLKKREHK